MKKIGILLIFCMISFWGYAGPVSRGQALKTATAYLQKNRMSRGLTPKLTLAYECQPKSSRSLGISSPLYYVFNQGEQQGFVIVSGDDRMIPVIGYVDQGSFDYSKVHQSMRWWLQAMEGTMLAVIKDKSYQSVQMLTDENLQPSVEPMVKVNWGQGKPYNDRCPFDSLHNGRSLVGCTAVAMAQVLSKWQYPSHGKGRVDYTTYSHKIRLREPLDSLVFDWEKMLPHYGGGKGTKEQCDAVAQLMYACGLSQKMDYCSIASGTFLKSYDFEKHFGLAPTCNDVDRLYFTRSEWDHLIKNELSAGRPVVYNGFSMNAGHSFVCDGYNSDGLFHINWGWDGSLNGYFALAELNSAVEHAGAPTDTEGTFNFDQSVTYGIQPKDNTEEKAGEMLYFTRIKSWQGNKRFNVKLTLDCVRADGNGFQGSFGLGVYDKEDMFLGCVGNLNTINLAPGYLYQEFTVGGSLPKEVVDGTYTLRPVFKKKNGDFVALKGRKGSGYLNAMILSVDGGTVTLSKPNLVNADLKLVSVKPYVEKAYAGAKNALEIKLRNEGAMYNGPIVLLRNDQDKYVKVFDNNYIIETGEEISILAKVKAPEGVEKDSLEIWMATIDEDLFYNNGFKEQFVDAFTYDLVKTTSGTPSINVDKFVINNKQVGLDKQLDVDITLINKGGFYGDKLTCFIFPKDGGASLGSGAKEIKIDKGDTLSLNLQIPIEYLPDGGYFLLPYINQEDAFKELTQTRYYFSKQTTGSFSITNKEGYNVFYLDEAFIVPEEVECGVVTDADSIGLVLDYRYKSGDIVPAGTGVVIKAESRKTYNYQLVPCDEQAPDDNLLSAQTDEKGYTYAGEGDYWYYMFKHGGRGENFGFYLKSESGEPYKLVKGRCYLALPKGMGKLDGYVFNQCETGIEDIFTVPLVKDEAVIYTLSGVRVYGKFSELPKGIYIVNGKKMMK